MNSLILSGAKFVTNTRIRRYFFYLSISMMFGDCIHHNYTFSQWPIFPAASLHDVGKFNICDFVLMDLLINFNFPLDFTGSLKMSKCRFTKYWNLQNQITMA